MYEQNAKQVSIIANYKVKTCHEIDLLWIVLVLCVWTKYKMLVDFYLEQLNHDKTIQCNTKHFCLYRSLLMAICVVVIGVATHSMLFWYFLV